MGDCFREKFIYNNDVRVSKEFDLFNPNGGKSLYEVLRIVEGVPLFLEDHLERLENSAKVTSLKLWMKKDEIRDKIYELCKVNDIFLGNIKLIFNYQEDESKNFLAYFIKHKYPSRDMYEDGVATALYHAERENPNAKVVNSKLREDTNNFIKEKNVYEAILVDNNGYITEGSRSTIFAIKGEKVYTSPIKDVLPGITRKYVLKVCEQSKIDVIEKRIHYTKIDDIDSFFICGTSPKVLPIHKVDYTKCDIDNYILEKIKVGYDNIIKQYINLNK
ncbi:aminotransferase class IV [Clostridium sp. MB40-C1]|uniref:aminotransferase class IV n=1 Tax=Clostridium sp. MB40-C1 TaxID=3070996 RepID=UPI0027DFFF07|nr:aminotransferase class IV [Clostridium sp. MB40-C1]WMJ81286.1 aminotransferase class IV [Clostridium sp. MB40-C1]